MFNAMEIQSNIEKQFILIDSEYLKAIFPVISEIK